jgi:hypothetical protein
LIYQDEKYEKNIDEILKETVSKLYNINPKNISIINTSVMVNG